MARHHASQARGARRAALVRHRAGRQRPRGRRREPVELGGRKLIPMSRSFIPAELADNPYLVNTGYQAVLDGLPEPLRSAVRDGNFMAARKDGEWQAIPTAWVMAAQARWTPGGFGRLGDDRDGVRSGRRRQGRGRIVLASRRLVRADRHRGAPRPPTARPRPARSSAPPRQCAGGGRCRRRLWRRGDAAARDNGIAHGAFNGAGKSTAKTIDGRLGFVNKRAEAWWRFREALDPDQKGGSVSRCRRPGAARRSHRADLRGRDDGRPRHPHRSQGRHPRALGRSPGKGDAVVMCLCEGNAAVMKAMRHEGGGQGLQTMSVRGYSQLKAGQVVGWVRLRSGVTHASAAQSVGARP